MNFLDKSSNRNLSSELRDVIKSAKAASIDISAITSQLQRALEDRQNAGNTFNDVVNTYQKLFDAMKSIISSYNVYIKVGTLVTQDSTIGIPINLTQDGYFTSGNISNNRIDSFEEICFLYEPKEIVFNLISGLTASAEVNKQKIKGIDDALRLVKAMSDDMEKKELSQSEVTV